MQLAFDLNRGYFVAAIGSADRLAALSFKRGDNLTVSVVFVRGVDQVELASGATGKLGIKTKGDYDGNFLASSSSWAKVGTGGDAVYNFELNLNTEGLNTALGVGPGADLESIVTMMEMQFVVSGVTTSSNTIAATIENDVVRGDETGPIVIAPGSPVNAVAATRARQNGVISTMPTNGQTTIIGGKTYTWVTSGTAANQIVIPANTTLVTTALRDAINNGVGTGGTANAQVSAVTIASTDLSFQALAAGAAGNSLTPVSGTFAGAWAANPSFGGGADAIPATAGFVGSMRVDASFLYVVGSMSGGEPVWRKIAHSAL